MVKDEYETVLEIECLRFQMSSEGMERKEEMLKYVMMGEYR